MKINRISLIKILDSVKSGLATDNIVEQATTFVFKEGRIYTYNQEVALSGPAPKEIEGAIEGRELYSILTKLTDEEIQIQFTDKEFLIKGKKSKAGIAKQTEISLPIGNTSTSKACLPLPEEFSQAVKSALFSASADLTKPELGCIHLQGNVVESCDNFRITQFIVNDVNFASVLIPFSAAEHLAKFNPTHYSYDGNWIHFFNEYDVALSCRTAEGTFPDTTQFLQVDGEHIDFPKNLPAALNRASVFLDEANPLCSIKLKEGITIRGQNAVGWFEEKIDSLYMGNEIAFQIQPKYLIDIMKRDCEVIIAERMLKFVSPGFIHCCAFQTEE